VVAEVAVISEEEAEISEEIVAQDIAAAGLAPQGETTEEETQDPAAERESERSHIIFTQSERTRPI
jgi:hypothetical protein